MSLLTPSESHAFQSFLSSIDYSETPEWNMYPPPEVVPDHIDVPQAQGKEALAKATKDLMSLDGDRWNSGASMGSDMQIQQRQQQHYNFHQQPQHHQQQQYEYEYQHEQQQNHIPYRHNQHDLFPFLNKPQQIQQPQLLHAHSSPSNQHPQHPSLNHSHSHPAHALPPISIAPLHTVGARGLLSAGPSSASTSTPTTSSTSSFASRSTSTFPSPSTPYLPQSLLHPNLPSPSASPSSSHSQRASPGASKRPLEQTLPPPPSTSNKRQRPSPPALPVPFPLPRSQSQLHAPHSSKPTLLSPSQKKANHIQSEQKRRANIRRGYEALCETVPALREAIREEESQMNGGMDSGDGKPGRGGRGKRGRGRGKAEDGEKIDGRAGPRSENVVLSKTIDYINDLLSDRSTLLARLHRARSSIAPGHPALTPLPNPNSVNPMIALWEREWKGGEGKTGDGEDDDEDDESS